VHKIMLKLSHKENPDPKTPVLLLSERAFKKITFWTQAAGERNQEVSGLGTIIANHGGLYVSDAYLIKPELVSSARVDQDAMAGILPLMERLLRDGRALKNLRFHWHSHANFGVCWSAVDEYTCREVFANDSPWTVSLVTNVAGHFLARMDFPLARKEPIHGLPVRLFAPIYAHKEKKWAQEYQDKYKVSPPSSTNRDSTGAIPLGK
jgi:hypothetical protein